MDNVALMKFVDNLVKPLKFRCYIFITFFAIEYQLWKNKRNNNNNNKYVALYITGVSLSDLYYCELSTVSCLNNELKTSLGKL